MSAEHYTLDLLPDDALVLVMQRLSVDDLLACRLVCRRLGGLALHSEVWRHRRLDDDHRKPCVCAVLSLAPCLDKVVYSKKVHTTAFATTTCAVRHLALHVRPDADCKRACPAVRNQHALGRLRTVELEMDFRHGCNRAYAVELLKTLMECFGLESLDVLNRLASDYAVRLLVNGPSGSCVNFFRSSLSENNATSINIVLAGLAATLEEVDLEDGSTYACSADTAALLAGMPRLRKLNCEVFPGMEALAACKTLVDLSIVAVSRLMDSDGYYHVENNALEGATKLLRQADQLRTVSLDLYDNEDADIDLKLMMQALTSSPRPLVELSINYAADIMEPLISALPQLPALRVLGLWGTVLFESDCEEEMDAFLLALTPTTTTPALRLLELSANDESESEGCVHRWLHRDSVKSVLKSNPQLHIHVPAPDECGRCDQCVARCHRQVTWGPTWGIEVRRGLGLCSHDPDQCPSPKDHTPDFVWLRINNTE